MSESSFISVYRDHYTDLLNERVGGRALACSDEWFAECASLVSALDPVFKKGHFVATGQWMDGWESRRSVGRSWRRESGEDYDWCELRLGVPGVICGVDIETTHYRGNAPEYAQLEGAWEAGEVDEHSQWFELLPKSPTEAHSHNEFAVAIDRPCTHLRLKIYPDGGVARLRAYGQPVVRPEHYIEGELLDLASVLHGGRGVLCSDMFYSSPSNMLMPRPGINMGDGWETRRRRDESYDWCIVKLGLVGSIRKVIVDTAHFKGNYPDSFSLESTLTEADDLSSADIQWRTAISRQPLYADRSHLFIDQIELPEDEQVSHVRLNIFPDGGISRLRVLGFPDWSQAAGGAVL
jgi:allantoicase